MNIKIVYGIVLLSIIAFGSYVVFNQKDSTLHTQDFIVGTAAGYAPFVSINERGEYEGFDIDVAHAVAEQMGKTLHIKDLGSMASLFMALDQGSIDAIIWGMSITQDRLKKVAMIRYQGATITSYPLLFWQHIPTNIQSITDMQGMTVCVEPASSQDLVLSQYPFITKKPIERVDDALMNIQYGKADAALVDPAIAKKFKRKYPEIIIFPLPLSSEDQVYGNGIVVKKDRLALIEKIEEAVDHLAQHGFFAYKEKEWGIDE